MFRMICASVMFLCAATLALAQDSRLRAMQSSQDGRGWEAVGRIDIARKGFCTGVLIREDLVLTAAHCAYDDDGAQIDPDRFEFLAGFREGRAEAYRGVRRLVTHPLYVHDDANRGRPADVANDIALLQLDHPIRTTRIRPFMIASNPVGGEEVGVVSYAQDRANAPSLQDICSVLGRVEGVLVMTCNVDPGASGSPVFRIRNGVAQVVSVVTSMSMMDDQKVSLGVYLQDPLEELLLILQETPQGIGQRSLVPGQRNDTGARFVSPSGG